MSTLGVMKARIASELARTNLADAIGYAITDAIRFYESDRFKFNGAVSSTITVARQEFYELPQDMVDCDELILIEGVHRKLLEKRPWHWIEAEQTTTDYYSRPHYFAVFANTIRLFPAPDAEYGLRMSYMKRLPALTNDNATNSWMSSGEELIRTHAKIDLLENVIRGPDAVQEARFLSERERKIHERLKSELSLQEATGRITPHE